MIKLLILIIFTFSVTNYAQNPAKKGKTSKKEAVNSKAKVPEDNGFDNMTLEDVKEKQSKLQKKRALMPYIAKFIEKEHIKKNEKEIPKIENKIKAIQKKIAVVNNPNAKKKLQADLKAEQIKLEVIKMWPVYHKIYVVYYESQQKKDSKKMNQAKEYLGKIKARYQELTAKDFPDPKFAFYAKYRKQIASAFADPDEENKN